VLQSLSRKCPGNAYTVAEYGQLWCHLSKQTQDLGKAMGYTYGGQVMLYFIFQLLGTFGFIFQMQQAKPLTTVGYLSTSLLFSWLIHVFCNAADRSTKFVRKGLISVFYSYCCGGRFDGISEKLNLQYSCRGCVLGYI
jgi:hypothetical protein